MLGHRSAPFSLSGTARSDKPAVSKPDPQPALNQSTLSFLLEQACDSQRTPQERVALFKSLIDQLPPRDEANGPLHAQCLRAMLRVVDPVERRRLFWLYHERHPFRMRTDDTPRLFAQVSLLQKPEHRSTEQTWAALARVGSPGPSTNWPVWRELCRVLAGQMAEVIQAFQQSRESPANKRRFNELVLRVVLRLAAPADGKPDKAGIHQFELLSDLIQAIPADHRRNCLRWLDNACAEWIDAAMKKRVKPESEDPLKTETKKYRPSAPMPVAELALLAALRLLGEQHGDEAAGQRFARLSDSRAESTVQGFTDRLREGKPLHGASAL